MKNKAILFSGIILILVIVICLGTNLNVAKGGGKIGSFIYPLKRIYYLASTFGEFRENHFHAGIDFTTRMRIREPVYAVDDGEIFRLKYQYRGYGKVLYIRHPKNIISVYAHLDRFENEKLKLEDLLHKYQIKKGKKYIDIYLDTGFIPVKKGQVIAYSGETGEGLPHLHFELRKGEDTPINPFDSFYKEPNDKFAPKVQGFIMCPDDLHAYIEGSKSCKIMKLTKKNNVYRTDFEPIVQGKFRVYVSTYDRGESIYWRAPFLVKFYIDGILAYEVKNSFFLFSENKYFGFLWDQGMHGYEYFNIPMEICNSNAERLSAVRFYNEKLCNFNLEEGKHHFRLQVADATMNSSIAELNINIRNDDRMVISEKFDEDRICVNFFNKDEHERLYRKYSHESIKVQYWDFIENRLKDYNEEIENARCGLRLRNLSNSNKDYYFRISYYDRGSWSPWFVDYRIDNINLIRSYVLRNQENVKSSDWQIVYGRNYISLIKHYVANIPVILSGKCFYDKGEEDVVIRQEINGLVNIDIEVPFDAKVIKCFLRDEIEDKRWEYDWKVNYAAANVSSLMTWDDVSMSIMSGSVLQDTSSWLEEIEYRQSELLPIIGKVKQFHPRGLYLPNYALVKIRIPKEVKEVEKLSLYRWSRKQNKWKLIISNFDKAEHSINGYIHYLDRIALILDNVKPVFYPLSPYQGQAFPKSPNKLFVRVYEEGMGINEDSLIVFIDSNRVEAEYDPDRDIIQILLKQKLSYGNHTLRVEGQDYAKNIAEPLLINFSIKN